VAYKLYTVEDGEEDPEPAEVANDRHPFQFISKLGVVLPAFEAAVVNLARGDEFNFTIPCKDAYGEFNDELMFDVPISVFMQDGKLDTNYIYEGAIVPMQGEDGNRFNAAIIEIKKEAVTIDLNHPRAGMDLHFVGRVLENRLATNQEISELLNAMSGCGGCGGCGGDSGDGGCGGSCGGCH
jgi:FKBP-type peptidyl-prolyl cis-trans isomerase SlyD